MRDYSYLSWLKKSNDPDYAWRQQKQMVIAFLAGWYFALWTTLAIVSYKMSWPIFPKTASLFMKLVFGSLMFAPYVMFMWWWLDKLNDVPVDETSHLQKRGIVTYSVFIAGILVAVLIPFLLQEILP